MNYRRYFFSGLFLLFASHPAVADYINGPNERCLRAGGNADARECFLAEFRQADRELNQVYTGIMSSLAANERQALINAQRAWIRYRDLFCTAAFTPYGMGTAVGTVDAACRASLTRQQVLNLRKAFR